MNRKQRLNILKKIAQEMEVSPKMGPTPTPIKERTEEEANMLAQQIYDKVINELDVDKLLSEMGIN